MLDLNVLLNRPQNDNKKFGWFSSLFGCVIPIINTIRFSRFKNDDNNFDEWIVRYESLNDLEYINSGSQGAVFKGKLNNRIIAVKKVWNSNEIEIEHLKKLKHNNVINFIGICKRPYCILMEFCSYGTLSGLIRRDKYNLEPYLVWEFLVQIASGMKYLHDNKIVHRDLKSGNILISDENQLKISDFGTAKKFDNDHSIKMTFAGTCAYMAPELIKNNTCTEKIDLWSYGVVVWELMTSEIPYSGVDNARIMFGVCSNTLSLPIHNNCPLGLKELMNKCWYLKSSYRPSFLDVVTKLNQPECLEFYTNYDINSFNQLKKLWKLNLDFEFKEMNKLSIPALDDDQRIEYDKMREKVKRELDDLTRIQKLYKDNYCEMQKLFSILNNKRDEECLASIIDRLRLIDENTSSEEEIMINLSSNFDSPL